MDFDRMKKLMSWDGNFEQLCEYKEKYNGKTNVPRNWKENPTLGEWCRKMRKKIRKDQLEQGKVARLESIGFRWKIGEVKDNEPTIAETEKEKDEVTEHESKEGDVDGTEE
jgi:hypothetical protein